MTFQMSLALLFDGTLALTCLFAFVRGGRPERIGALINLGASLITDGLRLFDRAYFEPVTFLMFFTDLAVVAAFYWLAATSTRFWPIWAFGFALADIVLSLAGTLLPRTPLFAFHTGLGLYAYLALFAMVIGAWALPRDAEPAERDGRRMKRRTGQIDRPNITRMVIWHDRWRR